MFNSDLAYGLSNDTYQAVERLDTGDPNYCPLQPNASGNGRFIEMMRRMVTDEQDADKGILWLLRGCPPQWFAEGQSIVVESAPTLFGKMSLRVSSSSNETAVDITCPDRRPPAEMRIALRHPRHVSPKSVTVNGQQAEWPGPVRPRHRAKPGMVLPQTGGGAGASPAPPPVSDSQSNARSHLTCAAHASMLEACQR